MIKKLYTSLATNFVWKVLSVAVATLLWFVVMNVNNPVTEDQFALNLQVLNKEALAENQLILLNEDSLALKFVTVRVSASVKAMSQLKQNEKNFKAYIDLKPIDVLRNAELGKNTTISVKYEFPELVDPDNYEIKSYYPDTVDIVVDKYAERDFSISMIKNGEGKTGYIALNSTLTPETVTVKGAKTIVDTVDSVEVTVDLKSATKDVSVSKPLKVLNKLGEDITKKVELSATKTMVQVYVDKYDKIPIQKPVVVGNVKDGYVFVSAVCSPQTIEVVGDEASIKELKTLKLPEIDIEGKSTTFSETIDLRKLLMDTKLTIKNGAPQEAVVTVQIVKEVERDIKIPIENILIEGKQLPFKITRDDVKIRVRGDELVLDALIAANLAPSVDLSGLGVGQHTLKVNLVLPNNITQVGDDAKVSVEIYEEEATPSPEPTPTNVATEPTETPPTDELSINEEIIQKLQEEKDKILSAE